MIQCQILIYRVINGNAFQKGRYFYNPRAFSVKIDRIRIKAGVMRLGNRKRLKRVDRTYKDLKQKQKAKIADGMFEKTCDYYREHGRMPEGEDCEKIAGQIYQRVKGIAEKASFDEIYSLYLYRLPRYEVRIA